MRTGPQRPVRILSGVGGLAAIALAAAVPFSPAIAQGTLPIAAAAANGLSDFYKARDGRPLWFSQNGRQADVLLEILGSASGFTANEPCTGLALCYNGDYILIDSIPYLDKHLFARGISKNQVSAVFLTHLHDDHCALFPLILMPRKVDIITTRAIFNMAMEKLSCHLNWNRDVIEAYFQFV